MKFKPYCDHMPWFLSKNLRPTEQYFDEGMNVHACAAVFSHLRKAIKQNNALLLLRNFDFTNSKIQQHFLSWAKWISLNIFKYPIFSYTSISSGSWWLAINTNFKAQLQVINIDLEGNWYSYKRFYLLILELKTKSWSISNS